MKKNYLDIHLFFLLIIVSADSLFAQNFWQQTNGPYGGIVNSLAINSTGHIFAGTTNGIFRSPDNGSSWTPVNTGLTYLVVDAFAINSIGHIFAGTNGGGIFRSTDNGNSWIRVNTGLTYLNVYALVINFNGHIFAGTGGGVFRSTDSGNSWTPVNTGLTSLSTNALAINSAGHIFAGTAFGGVFRSTNNGGSWTLVNTGLTNLTILVLAINSTGHIFAGTDGGVFRSTDNGSGWTPVLSNLKINALVINSSDHIFAGTTGGVFRSINNGSNWASGNTGMTNDWIRALAINSAGHIFAGTTGGGVFRSIDNSGNWIPLNTGLMNVYITALAINTSGNIFAGTCGAGIFRSTDNGGSWTLLNTSLTRWTFIPALAINSSGHIFAGIYGPGAFRSTDNGNTWTPINTGMANTSVYSFAINSSGHIFAGTDNYNDGIFRSTNNGSSWIRVNTGLTGIVVLALAVNSSGHIFAGTRGGGVIRSTDNGNSWTPVNIGLTNLNVSALAINSNEHIFAGTHVGLFRSTDNASSWTPVDNGDHRSLVINASGHIFSGTFWDGVRRSTNNGDNWISVNAGLNDSNIEALTINSIDHLFVGANGSGVFRSVQSTTGTNRLPVVSNAIPTQVINVGDPAFTRNLNEAPIMFADPDGDTLAYIASSSATNIAAAGIAGATLTVTPATIGNATITVMANDRKGGTASTRFGVTVLAQNLLPVVANAISNQFFIIGATTSFTRNLNAAPAVFNDPDGDMLTYTASSSATNIATASISEDTLTVSPASAGTATITVTANDGKGGTISTTFLATVNRPPIVAVTIANPILQLGGASFVRNLNTPPLVFTDPDEDTLTYTANSNERSIATASISEDTLTVTPVSAGNATITITANDGRRGTVSSTFTVTVNRPPLVINAISDRTIKLGGTPFSLDLNTVFSDPDGDVLTFTAMSSASNITTPTVSTNRLTVIPLAPGNSAITVTANDDKEGSRAMSFNISVLLGDPPSVTHTPIASQEANQPITITANITDDIGVALTILDYRRSGDVSFTPVSLMKISDTYQGTIPSSAVTSRGVEYYLQAIDRTGLETKSPIYSIEVRVSDEGESRGSAQPHGSEQSAYRIFSVPLNLDIKSVRAVLEDDLGPYDIFKWRCYEARPDQSRAEYPNIADMLPGKAVWLIVKDQGKTIDTGAGKSNPTSKPFAMALHPKWNLIGNPFNFAIPLSKFSLKSGSQPPELRSYTGSWNNPVTEKVIEMQSFQGYAVFNSLTNVDTLFVDPDLSTAQAARSSSFRNEKLQLIHTLPLKGQLQTSWSIHILAQCQQARDIDNIAAASANASDTHDELDRPEPPVIGEYVSVYFPHPEWKALSENYCTDIRPTTSDGGLWAFEVKTNIRDVVQLRFEGLDNVPQEFEVWLVDEVLKISHNLREKNRYSVAGAVAVAESAHPKRLKLVVGKRDFIDKQLTAVQVIPSNYELSQNFPNPFNPTTTIRFGLPREERVTLKVYNLFGQEVATLINNELKNAGYHAAIWDGRNNSGKAAASGVYFVRLRAGPSAGSGSAGSGQVFVQTRKMILVE